MTDEGLHGVEYDPQEDWLTVTDEDGATQIVAFQVPAWFGVRVIAAFDRLNEFDRLSEEPSE